VGRRLEESQRAQRKEAAYAKEVEKKSSVQSALIVLAEELISSFKSAGDIKIQIL
jgi:hypothetical protein